MCRGTPAFLLIHHLQSAIPASPTFRQVHSSALHTAALTQMSITSDSHHLLDFPSETMLLPCLLRIQNMEPGQYIAKHPPIALISCRCRVAALAVLSQFQFSCCSHVTPLNVTCDTLVLFTQSCQPPFLFLQPARTFLPRTGTPRKPSTCLSPSAGVGFNVLFSALPSLTPYVPSPFSHFVLHDTSLCFILSPLCQACPMFYLFTGMFH